MRIIVHDSGFKGRYNILVSYGQILKRQRECEEEKNGNSEYVQEDV